MLKVPSVVSTEATSRWVEFVDIDRTNLADRP